MERLTSNSNVSDMSMIELAHNGCYADNERNARYRDYNLDIDSRELVRNLVKDICDEDLTDLSDEEFDEYMSSMFSVEMDSTIGLLAVFYRNLWAMAELREKLKEYEDLEEQGRLIKLPSKVGNQIFIVKRYGVEEASITGISEADDISCFCFKVYIDPDCEEIVALEDFNKTWFLTKSEAEAKLKELRGGEIYQ